VTGAENRKITDAVNYVSSQWLPFYSAQSDELLKIDLVNSSQESREKALRLLRSDLALYSWCLLKGASEKDACDTLHERLLRGARVIQSSGVVPSAHVLGQSSHIQQSILRKTLSGSTCAEVISPYFSIDNETAFAVSALRELGRMLIAWNYPHIYSRAHDEVRTLDDPRVDYTTRLDEKINSVLGFSPLSLSLRFAQEMDLPKAIFLGMGGRHDNHAPKEVASLGATLKKIADISYAFAQASDSSAGTQELVAWGRCRDELIPLIGMNGMQFIRDSCQKVLKAYSAALPELVTGSSSSKILAPSERPSDQRYLANYHIPHCNDRVQDALRVVYVKINPRIISYDNVTYIIRNIAPVAGFLSGGIFLLNPERGALEPRILISSTAKNMPPIFYKEPAFAAHPIKMAFLSRLPMIDVREKDRVYALAGILGESQRVGVIYFELSEESNGGPPMPYRAHFKALQQALHDSLNID
jgi:hypothetical protein